MDRECYDVLSQLSLPNLYLITLEDIENGDEELLSVKHTRTPIEYYFTCTPSLPLFIFNRNPEVSSITYLDADLFFFAEPAPIYDEIAGHSIAIVEHRFAPHLRDREQYGIYNVGWLWFRRDEHALACLRWWRQRCIEWCYDRCEDGHFADQKYLDDWPSRFRGVAVLRHKGANLAPWNLGNYEIRRDGQYVWVDEQPLLFFHFHGLEQVGGWIYDLNLAGYKLKPSSAVLRDIYTPYIRTLSEVTEQVSPLLKKSTLRSTIRHQGTGRSFSKDVPLPRRVARSLIRPFDVCRGIFTREYVLVINHRLI